MKRSIKIIRTTVVYALLCLFFVGCKVEQVVIEPAEIMVERESTPAPVQLPPSPPASPTPTPIVYDPYIPTQYWPLTGPGLTKTEWDALCDTLAEVQWDSVSDVLGSYNIFIGAAGVEQCNLETQDMPKLYNDTLTYENGYALIHYGGSYNNMLLLFRSLDERVCPVCIIYMRVPYEEGCFTVKQIDDDLAFLIHQYDASRGTAYGEEWESWYSCETGERVFTYGIDLALPGATFMEFCCEPYKVLPGHPGEWTGLYSYYESCTIRDVVDRTDTILTLQAQSEATFILEEFDVIPVAGSEEEYYEETGNILEDFYEETTLLYYDIKKKEIINPDALVARTNRIEAYFKENGKPYIQAHLELLKGMRLTEWWWDEVYITDPMRLK